MKCCIAEQEQRFRPIQRIVGILEGIGKVDMGRTIVLCLSLVVIAIFVLLPFCFSIRQTNPEPKAAAAAAVEVSTTAVIAARNSAECSSSSRMGSRDVRTLFGGEPHSNHSLSNLDGDDGGDEDNKKPAHTQDSPESVSSTQEIMLDGK